MSSFNFADSYKAAGLAPGPEIIGLRQKPFDKLSAKIDAQIAVDLTRLYYGLPVPQGTEWFRAAFAETDPSFSMMDNEREAAVLSACLLDAAIEKGKEVAALAILTTSAGGNRKPLIFPELIEKARIAMLKIAIDHRHSQTVDISKFKIPTKSNIDEAADKLVTTPDWTAAAELHKLVYAESVKANINLSKQVQGLLIPLIEKVADLREEVEMLWWYVGGWSRILEKPFAGLEPGLAAVMAGLDFSDLSTTIAGPAAASAILQRTVSAGREADSTKVSINEAVSAFSADAYEKLELSEELNSVSDVCPVLAGFLKAHEIGESPAWESAFMKAAHFDSAVKFDLLDLAMQAYRERSLLAVFD